MNYLVATFGDRMATEAAYTALELTGYPLDKASIYGLGYKTETDLQALYDPYLTARQEMQRMLVWLVPFGFFAGFTFNQVTAIQIISSFTPLNNSVLGGLFGAIAGGLGSLTVGGGLKVVLSGKAGTPFRQRLRQGQYLLVVTGSETQLRQAERCLGPTSPLYLQAYETL